MPSAVETRIISSAHSRLCQTYGNASDKTTLEKLPEAKGSGLLAYQQIPVEPIAVVRAATPNFQ